MKKYVFAFALLICGFISAAVTMSIDDGDIIKKFIKLRVNGKIVEYPIEDVDSIFFADSVIHIPVIKEVVFSKDTINLEEGSTASLTYKVLEEDADQNCTISISDESIVKYENNTVTALAEGSAQIIATASDKETADTCVVNVTKKPEPEITEVTSVVLADRDAKVGEKIYLKARISPENAEVTSAKWTSDDLTVATAIQTEDNPLECAVSPKSAGKVKITVLVNDKVSASCYVTVTNSSSTVVDVTSVSVSPSSKTLEIGSTATLSATVSPSNATSKSVTWSSDDTSVATVNSTGKVTAVSAGTATITATAGGKTGTCKITVKAKEVTPEVTVDVTGVELDKKKITVGSGLTEKLTATVTPSNATNKSLIWSTSDNTIATVSGGTVTGKKTGVCDITVKTVDGGYTAMCSVTVTKVDLDFYNVDDATVTATTATAKVTLSGYLYDVTEAGIQYSLSADFPEEGSHCIAGNFSTSSSSYTTTISDLESATTYYYRAYVVENNEYKYSEVSRRFTTRSSDPFPVAEAVDLKLPSGLLWSSWNMGAQAECEVGGYYCWGDAAGEATSIYNYTNPGSSVDNISGNRTYDIATAQWGAKNIPQSSQQYVWRTPYLSEFIELFENTTEEVIELVLDNGTKVKVKKLTSKTDNSKYIYMPRGGRYSGSDLANYGSTGMYWTSDSNNPAKAERTSFNFSTYNNFWEGHLHGSYRLSIRPVAGKYVPPLTEEEIEALDREGETSAAGTAVDLGLSVRWADCNVGSTSKKASDTGKYYAWGETEPKSTYNISNYKYTIENTSNFKYLGDDIAGTEYDAAKVNWGGNWHMPTEDEWYELQTQCTWTWTTVDGVQGYKVYGKGDYSNNYIFLPITGYKSGSMELKSDAGTYWTSRIYNVEGRDQYNKSAWYAELKEGASNVLTYFDRYVGRCVRPVKPLRATK